MKFWKTCLIVFLGLFLGTTNVYAAQLPLDITAEYAESEQEILINVIAKEPVVLNAFTFVITYNMDVYKLYKGNDCVVNGYGYVPSFQTEYKKDGMVLCNVKENQVLFSGVNAESDMTYQGAIAQVSLLKYNQNAEVNVSSDIGFEITALCLNGETISIEEEEKQIPCEIQPVEQIVYEREQIPATSLDEESQQQVEMPRESSTPVISESVPASALPSLGVEDGIESREEAQRNSSASLSATAEAADVTSNEIAQTSKSAITDKETSKTITKTQTNKPQENSSHWYWLAVIVVSGGVIVAVVLWIRLKKKKNQS